MSALHDHRFLIGRRAAQLGLLLLFWLGANTGLDWLVGDLSASRLFGVVPLADPFAVLQILATGHLPASPALIGAALVLGGWFVLGGRSFCAWACPVNLVADTARWLRARFDLGKRFRLARQTRRWTLALALLLSISSGVAAFELLSPIGMIHRGLIYGSALSVLAVAGLLLLIDLLLLQGGWCGTLCPLGAFWSLVGRWSPTVISFDAASCDKCMDCVAVCPEKHVLNFKRLPDAGHVEAGDCTRCGRCVEVCHVEACQFALHPHRILPVEPKRRVHHAQVP